MIPSRLRDLWLIDESHLLDSRYRFGQDRVFKFSYRPATGEWLCARQPLDHKSMILAYGSGRFEDYVRGIYFRDEKTVYLRGHEREDWLEQTRRMLYRRGLGRDARVIWGEAAAHELADKLRGL